MASIRHIRNFSIVAHIDHGKSTLADRLLEMAGVLDPRKKKDQILDSMDVERERGITVKAQTVHIPYVDSTGQSYDINFIDTPGHVDFSYEVSRALMACEAILLLVDASQGIEAQTLAHFYTALEANLVIIPVINKIDLPTADVPTVMEQIEHELDIPKDRCIPISAKTGLGVERILEALVQKAPPPSGSSQSPLRVLIYDAYYDDYRGVVLLVRVFDGVVKKGTPIVFIQTQEHYVVEEVGFLRMQRFEKPELAAGEVGYIIANIKSLENIKIGDTICLVGQPVEPLPGFKEVKPVIFAGIFPEDSRTYPKLKEALGKLRLNDASLVFELETSQALGAGFRCGFLGMLHFEIIQERLLDEFKLPIIVSVPSVEYKVTLEHSKKIIFISNPSEFPEKHKISLVEEPIIRLQIFTPDTYLGNVLQLCQDKRGLQKKLQYFQDKRVELVYDMPLAEMIYDFHDKLKSVSKGYATFDYEWSGYLPTKVSKVDILVNNKVVDAFSFLCFETHAYHRGKVVIEKLKESIPKHMFAIPLQVAVSGKIIARETIRALRKDVTAKCYGGDISRKKKLLAKQKEGKKRMQMVGNVEIPQEAFMNIFKGDFSQNN